MGRDSQLKKFLANLTMTGNIWYQCYQLQSDGERERMNERMNERGEEEEEHVS